MFQGYVNVTKGSEQDLQVAIVAIASISVAIDASQDSFQFYKHGVYHKRHCLAVDLDHAVLAVVYNKSGFKDYYICIILRIHVLLLN